MRIALLIALSILTLGSSAQPDSATFPDFTYTDIAGETHHLYGYLDAGKTVIVDVMATWCPLCVNSIPGLEDVFETHGPGGDDTMRVLSFERDASTTNEVTWAANNGVNSPIITGAETLISDTWNITYQPRYFVICPDRSFQFHSGAINSNSAILTDLAANCAPPVSVTEEGALEGLSLAQTPTSIAIQGLSVPARFEVLSLNGSAVVNGQLSPAERTIETQALGAGVYLVRISTGTEVKVLRFVKA